MSALQANTIARLVLALKFSYYSQKPPRLHLFLGETLNQATKFTGVLTLLEAMLSTVKLRVKQEVNRKHLSI